MADKPLFNLDAKGRWRVNAPRDMKSTFIEFISDDYRHNESCEAASVIKDLQDGHFR